jgi:hypothetical protein
MSDLSVLCEAKGVSIESVLLQIPSHAHKINTTRPHVYFVGRPSDDWDKSAFHWSVTLTYNGRTFTTSYKTGCGHVDKASGMPTLNQAHDVKKVREPNAADVVSSLCSDARSGADTFEDFCGNFGYDTDSRKALDLYLQCQNIGRDVRRLLGADFDTFADAEH